MKVDVKNHIISFRHEEYTDLFIDVVIDFDGFEAWMYISDQGIKMLMFGVSKSDCDFSEFMDLVEKNVPMYLNLYRDHYVTD